MTFRYYDPQAGRFVTRDPLGYGGGVDLYAYTQNDPVNGSDPLGLEGSVGAPPVPGVPEPPTLSPPERITPIRVVPPGGGGPPDIVKVGGTICMVIAGVLACKTEPKDPKEWPQPKPAPKPTTGPSCSRLECTLDPSNPPRPAFPDDPEAGTICTYKCLDLDKGTYKTQQIISPPGYPCEETTTINMPD